MNEEKVSIVVPVYNMERYLRKCIQSLIEQTYRNIEIIVVNDGSSDRSADICHEYCEIDSRIIYIEQRNQGVSAARNIGIERASGSWIAFTDSDDWVAPEMISSLLENASESDIVIGDFIAVKHNCEIHSSFFQNKIDRGLWDDPLYLIGNALGCSTYGAGVFSNIGVPWARIYRKEFIMSSRARFPVGIRRMQDMLFNLRIFLHSPRVSFCENAIYSYRITESSVCHRYDPDFDNVAKCIMECIESILDKGADEKWQKLIAYKKTELLQEIISLHYCHPSSNLTTKEKITALKKVCCEKACHDVLKTYPRDMCTWKQRLVLDALCCHMYVFVVLIYSIKNR